MHSLRALLLRQVLLGTHSGSKSRFGGLLESVCFAERGHFPSGVRLPGRVRSRSSIDQFLLHLGVSW